MTKFKSIIIYGVILILCAAAVIGYIMSDRQAAKTDVGNASSVVSGTSTAEAETAGTGTVTAAEASGTSAGAEETETAGTGGGSAEAAVVNSGNADKDAHIKAIMAKSIATPDPNPVIGVGRGEDYAKVTEEAIKNAGGLQDIVKKGDVVVIKPNICTYAGEGSPKITDYRTVQKIADMVGSLGASKIIIAEGTIAGDAFSTIFTQLNKYDTIKGVELINLNALNEEDCYELMPEKSLTGKALFIPKVYMDADVVINVAKLKTHFQPDAVVSLSLKNSYGVPPGSIYGLGSKDGLHMLGLKESIVDLNKIRKPDFSLIEGIVGGEGYGPLSNDPVKSDIIFAGKDPVALDTIALTFMGFSVDEIPHVKLASEEKLGISDLGSIKVVGAVIDSIKMNFKRALG